MDALQISGKWYISSRRAAKEHGYHVDYIGQLIRTGKVKGQKVGRSWYVLADSLSDYLEKEGGVPQKVVAKKAAPAPKKQAPHKSASAKVRVPEPVEEEEEEEPLEEAEPLEESLPAEIEAEEKMDKVEDPNDGRTNVFAPVDVEEEPKDVPEKGTPTPPSKQEHELLTYLHDDEPILPAIPPHPVVPSTGAPHAPIAPKEEVEEGAVRIPIHAAVKRFNVIARRRPAQEQKEYHAMTPVAALRTPASPRSRSSLTPFLYIGALAFIATIGLSLAISSTITAL